MNEEKNKKGFDSLISSMDRGNGDTVTIFEGYSVKPNSQFEDLIQKDEVCLYGEHECNLRTVFRNKHMNPIEHYYVLELIWMPGIHIPEDSMKLSQIIDWLQIKHKNFEMTGQIIGDIFEQIMRSLNFVKVSEPETDKLKYPTAQDYQRRFFIVHQNDCDKIKKIYKDENNNKAAEEVVREGLPSEAERQSNGEHISETK